MSFGILCECGLDKFWKLQFGFKFSVIFPLTIHSALIPHATQVDRDLFLFINQHTSKFKKFSKMLTCEHFWIQMFQRIVS